MDEQISKLEFFSWRDFIAGWVSGICSISVGYPFETIKVRQQMTPDLGTAFRHVTVMLKNEGMRSFFRGLSYPLWTTGVLNSLYFGFYGNSLRMIEDFKDEKNYRNCCEYGQVYRGWHWDCFWAGCIGGTISTLANTPIELAKTICQAHASKRHTKVISPTSCLLDLFKRRGLRGCYHGGAVLLIRDVPTFGMYTVCYEHIACVLKRRDSSSSSSMKMCYEGIAGGLSGVITWFVAIPVDVIKSRYMSDSVNKKRRYTGIVDCLQKTYTDHGLSAFYRGLGISLLRAFPVNLLCFVAYEQTLRFL